MDTHEKKKALRRQLRQLDKEIRAGVAAEPEWLPEIIGLIESLVEFTSARTVALYCALPDEVPTAAMLARWFGTKRLVLPVISGEEMTFREYTGEGGLVEGAFGISEPDGTNDKEGEVAPSEIDLMLVPGMAFDVAGRRLGRGKGFYDRYLSASDAARICKVGICPPHRLVAEVPAEPHDITMDKVISHGKLGKQER
ncbi:MAG: 5-formyltetrahydrofolate cyclo-ligase [Alistipes sp.]|jgi:5-formyltetrahydrofolate cyclo-ligase|nr:5-formyltetrahydrofolate cyclo-ligase [Alistipes sp.]